MSRPTTAMDLHALVGWSLGEREVGPNAGRSSGCGPERSADGDRGSSVPMGACSSRMRSSQPMSLSVLPSVSPAKVEGYSQIGMHRTKYAAGRCMRAHEGKGLNPHRAPTAATSFRRHPASEEPVSVVTVRGAGSTRACSTAADGAAQFNRPYPERS